MPAGNLRDRVRLESPTEVDDGAGNMTEGWSTRFERAAEIIPLRGGEDVMAGRLQGRQPVIIRLRYDPETAQITPDWRLVDARYGSVYAIRSAADMERRGQWWTLVCETGVAA